MMESNVVQFRQSADFLRARGLKQKRAGHPLEALELLRLADEAAGGTSCRMDMAEVYADMHCLHDSRVMTILHIFSQTLDADAYYRLAKYDMEMGALPEAEKAFSRYLLWVGEGEQADDAREDMDDIQSAYRMWKQIDRQTRRKVRRLREVRRMQIMKDFAGADRLFEKELAVVPTDSQMRVNRAMNLCMMGENDAARREIDLASRDIAEYAGAIIILAAQVYYRLGDTPRADGLLSLLQRQQMSAQEWQMLMALQADMQRDRDAYHSGGEVLKLQPYDRRMLHLMAVTAARLDMDEKVISGYWERILRIDPEDDVALWHLQQLRSGALTKDMLFDAFALPAPERLRRLKRLQDMLHAPETVADMWQTDGDVRRVLHWALFSESPASVEPAIRLLEQAAAPEGFRWLAEFVARSHQDMSLKLQAVQAIQAAEPEKWPGMTAFVQMWLIPGTQEVLDSLPVSYRQMVRMAQEILETEYSCKADLPLALQCANYLQSTFGEFNRLLDLRCAAAALALIELRASGRDADIRDLADLFRCSARKLNYYAGYISGMPGLTGEE